MRKVIELTDVQEAHLRIEKYKIENIYEHNKVTMLRISSQAKCLCYVSKNAPFTNYRIFASLDSESDQSTFEKSEQQLSLLVISIHK